MKMIHALVFGVLRNRQFGFIWKKGPLRRQAGSFIEFAEAYDMSPYIG